jgi:hypothetical protein
LTKYTGCHFEHKRANYVCGNCIFEFFPLNYDDWRVVNIVYTYARTQLLISLRASKVWFIIRTRAPVSEIKFYCWSFHASLMYLSRKRVFFCLTSIPNFVFYLFFVIVIEPFLIKCSFNWFISDNGLVIYLKELLDFNLDLKKKYRSRTWPVWTKTPMISPSSLRVTLQAIYRWKTSDERNTIS